MRGKLFSSCDYQKVDKNNNGGLYSATEEAAFIYNKIINKQP